MNEGYGLDAGTAFLERRDGYGMFGSCRLLAEKTRYDLKVVLHAVVDLLEEHLFLLERCPDPFFRLHQRVQLSFFHIGYHCVLDAYADLRAERHEEIDVTLEQDPFRFHVINGEYTYCVIDTDDGATDKGFHPHVPDKIQAVRGKIMFDLIDIVDQEGPPLPNRSEARGNNADEETGVQ